MRKWLPVLPLALVVALTAIAYPTLPSAIEPAWQYLLPIEAASESLPRDAFVLLVPGLMLLVCGLLVVLARVRHVATVDDGLTAPAVERFEPTYHIVVFAVVSLLGLAHIMLLAGAGGWPDWTFKAVGVTLGAGLILVGNLMPRVRPNWIVGVRTRATLTDPSLWLRTHRYFGGLLMASGILVVVVALTATRYSFVTLAAGIVVSAALAHLWATTRTPPAAAVIGGVLITLVTAVAHGQRVTPVEEAFDIRAKQLTLPGTLTLPTDAKPDVVVMVAGSGPTGRNGNGPLTQTDLYKQIAHALARGGFASVRYDKRGIGPSAGTIDHTALSVDDYVADVTAAVDTLIASGRFSRVFLLGHSEGTMHVVLASKG